MRAASDRIAATLESAGLKADVTAQALGVVCRVAPGQCGRVLDTLREAGYTSLVDLFAADTRRKLELTYHLRCADDGREVFVRTRAGYDAVVHSASDIFPSAANAEREAAELFGLTFTGLEGMRRLLTTSEAGEPPMRKTVALFSRGGRR